MSYLSEAPESAERSALYSDEVARLGYVANYTKVFGERPAVYRAWLGLAGAVRSSMSFERFEVATIAAAQQRGSDYCALAHGKMLAERVDPETVVKIATGSSDDPEQQAIRALAGKVAATPADITPADLEPLRRLGFSDADVLDVVLATALRCFFSTVLSATGAEPDAVLTGQDPALVAALTGAGSSTSA
jgi:uncharacterized peroxidase-related enzyme